MEQSIFSILGPVMIGPSSSHTAGAAKLGRVAKGIIGMPYDEVKFYLHGSFAKTYRGHGTDKALVAGVLGFDESDERLRNSFAIAKEQGLAFSFEPIELENAHENTVRMVFYRQGEKVSSVTGSSIGGGNIIITRFDGFDVEFTGKMPTIIIKHLDKAGTIGNVSTLLGRAGINIATMSVSRRSRGDKASMLIETDDNITDAIVSELEQIPNIISVKVINIAG